MDQKDPDSGYPTPRDDENEPSKNTNSKFNPPFFSTPNAQARGSRLNSHTRSETQRSTEDEEEYFSPDDERASHDLNRTNSKEVSIEALHQSLDFLNETIESKEKMLQEEREKNEKITADYKVLKLTKEETERELDVRTSGVMKDRKERKEIQERIHQLEEELKGAQGRATFEANENIKWAKKFASTKDELEKARQDIAKLSTEIDSDKQTSDEKIRALEESLWKAADERQQIEKDRDTTAQELKDNVEQKLLLETLVSDLRKNEQGLRDQIEAMEKDIRGHTKTSDEWQHKADQSHQLEEELKGAQDRATFEANENIKWAKKFASTKDELEKARQDIAKLSTEIDSDKQTSDEKIRALEESLWKAADERQQIEKDRDTTAQELKDNVEQKLALETLVSDIRKNEHGLRYQIEAMEKDIRGHTKICDEWKHEADQYKCELLAQKEELEQARSWTAEREQLKSELLAQKEELDDKNSEIARLIEDTRVANSQIVKQKELIEKLINEHTEFEADAQRVEEEYEAAKIRLQELEAIDGYPGKSTDASTNTVGPSFESMREQLESLQSILADERSHIRQLNADLRERGRECGELKGAVESLSNDLGQSELDATNYRHNCNELELKLSNAEAKIIKLNAEQSTINRCIKEMRQFVMVDNPIVLDNLEKEKQRLNVDIQRLQRNIVSFKEDIQSRDHQITNNEAEINQLKLNLLHANIDLVSKRQLIHANQETVCELLKKMKEQETFIQRCRNRNRDRQTVIEQLEEKLRNAYSHLGRDPTWGKLPEKKERWAREDEADNLALDTITNKMNNILRERNTQMFRDARRRLDGEEPQLDVTLHSGDITRLSQIGNVLVSSVNPLRRSISVAAVRSGGQSRASSSMAEPRLDKENLSRNLNSHN